MNKRIVFKGMESSPAVENFLNDKFTKVEKFLEGEQDPINVDIAMNAEHSDNLFDVEIRISGPHFSLIAHEQSREMYATIERAIDKMAKEINAMKKKRIKKMQKIDTYKGA